MITIGSPLASALSGPGVADTKAMRRPSGAHATDRPADGSGWFVSSTGASSRAPLPSAFADHEAGALGAAARGTRAAGRRAPTGDSTSRAAARVLTPVCEVQDRDDRRGAGPARRCAPPSRPRACRSGESSTWPTEVSANRSSGARPPGLAWPAQREGAARAREASEHGGEYIGPRLRLACPGEC